MLTFASLIIYQQFNSKHSLVAIVNLYSSSSLLTFASINLEEDTKNHTLTIIKKMKEWETRCKNNFAVKTSIYRSLKDTYKATLEVCVVSKGNLSKKSYDQIIHSNKKIF